MPWYWKDMGIQNGRRKLVAINQCCECGEEFRSDNPSSAKYCPACAALVRKRLNLERVHRYREKLKAKK